YDSFTYNLVQYLGELGHQSTVVRNDAIEVDEIENMAPSGILISPGPCTPNEAGISIAAVERYSEKLPILGVCLGHQSICQAFGGEILRADQVMHGKVSDIYHNCEGIFEGIQNPFTATRYHSLIAQRKSLPESLEITAWTSDGIIMGVKHKQHHVYGVQFHPESFLTDCGHDLLRNFLKVSNLSE
ncbi:MAG: aminodeoxychorismate/anthranilate synthase component II, partial [Gammaproteobacteria bacterium]|nr:aminodeoxychorismate/anthranilate synthase component II [Gammaproteobacteria bacterium]